MICMESNCVESLKLNTISTTLSTLYAILLFCIFTAFSYTELVKFPALNHWLEINGFFIYLYVLSIIYLIYILVVVLKGTKKTAEGFEQIKVIENNEVSYIIIAIRIGSSDKLIFNFLHHCLKWFFLLIFRVMVV